MGSQQSWQRLITQALNDTGIDATRGNKCSPISVYEYIYRALNLAGINNRPPFGWYRILSIWWQARGDAEQIKQLCIQSIRQMKKPESGFKPSPRLVQLLTLALLVIALLPQNTNILLNSPNQQSFLHIKPRPMEDIDRIEITLPSSADYIFAANQFLGKPVLFDREQGLHGIDWIRSQKDDTYSLQMISTFTRQALFDFCKEQNICEKSAYYQGQVKGKTYFRLLYGNFKNQKAAQRALSNLPAKLQELNPWPRNFKQIKSEI